MGEFATIILNVCDLRVKKQVNALGVAMAVTGWELTMAKQAYYWSGGDNDRISVTIPISLANPHQPGKWSKWLLMATPIFIVHL